MKKSIRCCISCILPCGALDIIRIVHANGKVEEISGTIKASEIMKAHPKHVLKKPSGSSSSSSSDQGINCPNIVLVPPDVQLQRGKIYFLVPLPPEKRNHQKTTPSKSRKKKREQAAATAHHSNHRPQSCRNNNVSAADFVVSDQYLGEILSEKLSTERDRRRGRAGVWRPHLECISETPAEA